MLSNFRYFSALVLSLKLQFSIMQIRVVLVETEYSSNLGSVCRVMKNFGFCELYLVYPKCEINVDAYKGAKHAKDVLENAKKTNWADAVNGCDFVIGTSGIKIRNKGTIRGVLGLRQFAKKAAYYKDKKIALVFGREGIGLNQDELNECDIILHIESAEQYPVLNLSHAAGIVLYMLSGLESGQGEKPADTDHIRALDKMFGELEAKVKGRSRLGRIAFRRIMNRGRINEFEATAMLNVFRGLLEIFR